MEESIFEYLERTKAVDYALAAIAVLGPLLVAAVVMWGRRWRFVHERRPDWWLWLAAGPLLYLLWWVYNAIMDAYGLDNLYALILNAAIFVCVGLVLALARIWLWRLYGSVPEPVAQAPAATDGELPPPDSSASPAEKNE
jgi:hypothetical protein